MHWVDVMAKELIERSKQVVIATGTSISGVIHIGNTGDIIIGDGVARGVREAGGEAKLLWIMDDVDPLRSVPKGIPESFSEYFGKPDYNVPDPWGCHERFTMHFTLPFIESLRDVGIRPEVLSGYEMYRDGVYEPMVKVALQNADRIRQILEDVSGTQKKDTWLPWEATCENCGKIITTHVEKYDGSRVFYRCVGGVAGHKEMKGCGHEGWSDLRHGKLPWRVEWAARWKILGVTCEPFGKEHSAAGGSYDTSKRIVEEIYDYPAPYPVKYEYILVDGKKMSSSKGNVFTIQQMLEILPPDLMRFFFFRTYISKHKEFKFPDDALVLMDEYERFERVYYGATNEGVPDKEVEDVKRAYVLSRIQRPSEKMAQVPYKHLLIVASLYETWDRALPVLKRGGYSVEDSDAEVLRRFEFAKKYVELYVKDRLKILETTPQISFDEVQKSILKALAGKMPGLDWSPASIHQAIHETSKSLGASSGDAFRAVYLSLLGRENGPRAGYFLSSLDPQFVIQRFKDIGGG